MLEQAGAAWDGDESAAQVEARLVEVLRNATLGDAVVGGGEGESEGRQVDRTEARAGPPRVLDVGVLCLGDGASGIDSGDGEHEAGGGVGDAFVWRAATRRRPVVWSASSHVHRP